MVALMTDSPRLVVVLTTEADLGQGSDPRGGSAGAPLGGLCVVAAAPVAVQLEG